MKFKTFLGSISVSNGLAIIALMGIFACAATAKENDNDRDFDHPHIRRSFEIAPELNLRG